MTFFEKRDESCHQKRDMPLVSFGLNIFIFCCIYTGPKFQPISPDDVDFSGDIKL